MGFKPIALILFALLVLALPGMLYNNMNNNGLVVSQSQALTCSSNPQDPTCQISGNVGCQASSTYCTLSGSSISFLSSTSIFTQLIQGNVFGLFENVNGPGYSGAGAQTGAWSGAHGPFDFVSQAPAYYSADCQGQPAGASRSQTQWAVGRCTQTGTDGKNTTYANTATWANWNTNWNTTVRLHFFQLGNTTFARSCTYIGQVNFTAVANGPGYTYFGCTINHAPSVQGVTSPTLTQPTHRSWAYLVAMPVSYGIMPVGQSHQVLFIQLENWNTQSCIGNFPLNYYTSNGCDRFLAAFKGVSIPGSSLTFVPNSSMGIILGFLMGVVLFLLGLGLTVNVGGGVGAGTNEQGTKLFQVLGLGLIVWVPLYSEFSTWFTSGLLPYGLDGTLGIIALTLSGLFFFGIFWMSQSRE